MKESAMIPLHHIQWLNDLVGVEIVLWNRIDARLLQAHNLSLAFFQSLYFIDQSPDGTLRIGDLARSLRITVGATSKLVDRVEAAGLICRQLDADDRRASRVALTESGSQVLVAASTTYTAELAVILDATLTLEEQQLLHTLVKRLLTTTNQEEAGL